MKLFLIFILMLCSATTVFAINEKDFKIMECDNKTGVCIIRNQDFKNGLMDKNKNIILPCEYLRIEPDYFPDKFRIQKFDLKLGLADKQTGKVDVPPMYNTIYKLKNNQYMVSKDNDLNGIISADFKVIIPPEYYFIMLFPGDKYYRLHKEFSNSADKYGIADMSGKLIVPVDCEWISKNTSSYEQQFKRNGRKYIFNSNTGAIKEVK